MQRGHLMGVRLLIIGVVVAGLTACINDASNNAKSDSLNPGQPAHRNTTFWPDSMHHEGTTCGPEDSIRAGQVPPDAASWDTWSIPEFQDTQRFVTGASTVYGPIACIAARENLHELNDRAFMAGAVLVAVIHVDTGRLTPAYTQLKLTNGFNCVFVQQVSTGGNSVPVPIPALGNANGRVDSRWRGYIVPSRDRVCDPIRPAAQLPTFALTAVGDAPNWYPGVARFMILDNWKPAVGVRCGPAWCVIGAASPAVLPAPAHVARVGGSIGRERTMMVVPGWYDEQQLAVPGGGGPLGIKAMLKASIVPDPALDTLTIASFDAGFVPVATIYFEQTPTDKYLNDYQFHLGSTQPDTLFLHHITTGTPHWVARVNRSPRYFRVMRTPHPPHVTGTARWSWRDNDEVIWVRCEDGCCLVDSDWSTMITSLDMIFRRERKTG